MTKEALEGLLINMCFSHMDNIIRISEELKKETDPLARAAYVGGITVLFGALEGLTDFVEGYLGKEEADALRSLHEKMEKVLKDAKMSIRHRRQQNESKK